MCSSDLGQFDVVADSLGAADEDQGVAPVSVDIHVPRVELEQADPAAGRARRRVLVEQPAEAEAGKRRTSLHRGDDA